LDFSFSSYARAYWSIPGNATESAMCLNVTASHIQQAGAECGGPGGATVVHAQQRRQSLHYRPLQLQVPCLRHGGDGQVFPEVTHVLLFAS